MAGDLSFDQRLLQATDAGRFAGRIHRWLRCLLPRVDFDATFRYRAAKQRGQFQIWHESESTGHQVALDTPPLPAVTKRRGADLRMAVEAYRPAAAQIRHATQHTAQLQRLPQ